MPLAGRSIAALAFGLAALLASAQERVRDLVYLKEGGAVFTMDAFRPAKPNGIGVLFVVSGGWFSNHANINSDLAKPFTDRGITLFQVVHGSQPRYKIHEIQRQITRAVRYVRANAATYGVAPDRLGITGGSAGGQLSLMTAGTADDGRADATDPVDRASSRLQAVVALFPPTDFLNFGGSGRVPINEPAMGVFQPAFGVDPKGPRDKILAYLREISPIYRVTPAFPPTLLIHGDKDLLVPIEQSRRFDDALATAKVDHKLIVVTGAGHGGAAFLPSLVDEAEWFLTKLAPK